MQNLRYRIEERQNEGIITYTLLWGYERDLNKGRSWNFHGQVTEDEIKTLLGGQWSKFRQDRRDFTIQRRIDKHNIPPKNAA